MDGEWTTPRHPIGVAAERTGLSTDVIRAWERRYGAVDPTRDETGQRVYSDADVERLRLLRRATEGGRSIGQVVTLEGEALRELVREDEAARAEAEASAARGGGPAGAKPAADSVLLESLEALAKALDGEALEAELVRSLMALGLARFAEEVAGPLLRRLGDGWHAGTITPAQEHVASAAVRRILESARERGRNGRVAVVGTLSGDRHETGALMAAGAASLAGWRVVYLGPDLPVDDLAEAAKSTGAGAVCASAVYAPDADAVVERFRALRARLPDTVAVFAGGSAAEALRARLEAVGVSCPGDVRSLQRALEAEAGRTA